MWQANERDDKSFINISDNGHDFALGPHVALDGNGILPLHVDDKALALHNGSRQGVGNGYVANHAPLRVDNVDARHETLDPLRFQDDRDELLPAHGAFARLVGARVRHALDAIDAEHVAAHEHRVALAAQNVHAHGARVFAAFLADDAQRGLALAPQLNGDTKGSDAREAQHVLVCAQ